MRYVLNQVAEDEYQIVDTENSDHLVAICDNRSDGEIVSAALNFNNKPSEYGYKLVIE